MARRYQRKTDWHWLRSITEGSLNASGKFPFSVSVDGKIEWIDSGLYHDNYRFWIVGPELPEEWQDKSLLLRLSTQKKCRGPKLKRSNIFCGKRRPCKP